MIRIKESYKPGWKMGKISDGVWLEKAIHRKDALGRTGKEVFDAHEIQIVRGQEEADFGFSMHGDPVHGLPPPKCILFKGEPPIYNIYFGRKLCKQSFLDKYMATMSNTIIDGLDQVLFNSPQNAFEHMEECFDYPKDKFLCMILKNKKKSLLLNSLVPGLRKYNLYSNHKLRDECDKFFCNYLGPSLYNSYGEGWCPACYKGKVGFRGEYLRDGKYFNPLPPEYEVIREYRFNFCPENSRFPGYVTEKPIQAMVCGSIPIYLGAPNIEEYFPKGTFIDFSYRTKEELCEYLKTLTNKEIKRYQKNIKRFITSQEADPFSSYIFAKKLVKILEDNA